MHWESRLIGLYLIISDTAAKVKFRRNIRRGHEPGLHDCEVTTLYIFGLLEGRTECSAIFRHAKDYMADFFPQLSSYKSFNSRVNQCSYLIEQLVTHLHGFLLSQKELANCWMIDSMPIVLAQGSRSFGAKIAKGIANKGYCASKKMHYHGVKLHILGRHEHGTIPIPEKIGVTNASMHDLTGGRDMLRKITNGICLGDKAYADAKFKKECVDKRNLRLFTPVKKPKNGILTRSDKDFSTTVSRHRQPIETFFSWIQEHTKIQKGSKIRSNSGLVVHIFSRLAAALIRRLFCQLVGGQKPLQAKGLA